MNKNAPPKFTAAHRAEIQRHVDYYGPADEPGSISAPLALALALAVLPFGPSKPTNLLNTTIEDARSYRRARGYAGKYLADGGTLPPTDESIRAVLAGCVRPPRPGEEPEIASAIREVGALDFTAAHRARLQAFVDYYATATHLDGFGDPDAKGLPWSLVRAVTAALPLLDAARVIRFTIDRAEGRLTDLDREVMIGVLFGGAVGEHDNGPATLAAIDALAPGETYRGGGGLEPEWTVTREVVS